MIVCKRCLIAIESHEGSVFHRHIDYTEYEGSTVKCEWCEEEYETSEMEEILGD